MPSMWDVSAWLGRTLSEWRSWCESPGGVSAANHNTAGEMKGVADRMKSVAEA